jgi:hypothetical protein
MQAKSKKSVSRSSPRKKGGVKKDDFVSVARRIEADEDKGRFERMLGKLAKAKLPAKKP